MKTTAPTIETHVHIPKPVYRELIRLANEADDSINHLAIVLLKEAIAARALAPQNRGNPMTNLTPDTMTWLHRLGHFGPTWDGETVKGWALHLDDTGADDYYERVYLDAEALRHLATAAQEVAALLDALRQLPEAERKAEVSRISDAIYEQFERDHGREVDA